MTHPFKIQRIEIEDRDCLSLDPVLKHKNIILRIINLFMKKPSEVLYDGVYKFWTTDNNCIRPGMIIITENGVSWFVTLVGQYGIIMAKTLRPHPLHVYELMEQEGTLIVTGNAATEYEVDPKRH